MRTAFIETLCEVAERDERVWLLTGDLGFSVLETFAERFPERYVNVGVAEQNMMGIAAGLAASGRVVFTYSIANFPTFRCLEQVRNDISYHSSNVKIVAVGSGFTYGVQGYTHHGVEDMGVMRSLPNMTVVSPGDPVEARLITRQIAAMDGPCYLRLGRAGDPVVHESEPALTIGQPIRVRDGDDVSLVSTGAILPVVMETADELQNRGVSASVVSMHTIKPLDTEFLRSEATHFPLICTVEEHVPRGGLADAVARPLASLPGWRGTLINVAVEGNPAEWSLGSQSYMRKNAGLTAHDIADKVERMLSIQAAL